MARAKKNIGLQGKKEVLNNINHLMQIMGQKYSIKVGIIGEKAYEKHEGTDLTNAQLGATHEFGATINHPGGQPYYINDKTGQAVFISKTSALGKKLIERGQVTKPHTIILPTRSFLRATLLSPEGKKELLDSINFNDTLGGYSAERQLWMQIRDGKFTLKDIAETIGSTALQMVKQAFEEEGKPIKWTPITQYTRKHRINSPESGILQDGGDLLDSISVEVKKVE